MPVSSARHSAGTHLRTDFSGGTTYADWAEVYEITGPEINLTIIDVTNLTSPTFWKEKVVGFIDAGALTFSLNWTRAAYNNGITHLRTKLNWQLQFALAGTEINNAALTFAGYISKFPTKIPTDNKIDQASCAIEITSALTYTDAS